MIRPSDSGCKTHEFDPHQTPSISKNNTQGTVFCALLPRLRTSLPVCWLSLLALMWIVSAANAQTPALVHPDPLVFVIGAGEEKTLDIVIENAVDIYGIDVQGSFDKDAVEVVDANPSKPGIQLVPGSIPKPDFVVINTADNSLGSFQYVLTQINPSPPMSGDGTVFSIKFQGKTVGETALVITKVEAADRNGKSLQVTFESGTIKVLPGTSVFTLYIPITRR